MRLFKSRPKPEEAMDEQVKTAVTVNRSAIQGLVNEALQLIAERKQQKERPLVEPVPNGSKDQ